MGSIALAALAGFLGKGPVSDARAGGAYAGLEVEYQRFGRRNAPQTLRFHVASRPDPEGKVQVSIDREYLDSIQIENVMPEPESVQGGPDRHLYEFAAPGGETTISIKFNPEALGWVEGAAALEGRPVVQFRQFMYP